MPHMRQHSAYASRNEHLQDGSYSDPYHIQSLTHAVRGAEGRKGPGEVGMFFPACDFDLVPTASEDKWYVQMQKQK